MIGATLSPMSLGLLASPQMMSGAPSAMPQAGGAAPQAAGAAGLYGAAQAPIPGVAGGSPQGLYDVLGQLRQLGIVGADPTQQLQPNGDPGHGSESTQ